MQSRIETDLCSFSENDENLITLYKFFLPTLALFITTKKMSNYIFKNASPSGRLQMRPKLASFFTQVMIYDCFWIPACSAWGGERYIRRVSRLSVWFALLGKPHSIWHYRCGGIFDIQISYKAECNIPNGMARPGARCQSDLISVCCMHIYRYDFS